MLQVLSQEKEREKEKKKTILLRMIACVFVFRGEGVFIEGGIFRE